ncbi:hypothetical protein [Methylorubrum extorquens]|uniref:hypothetical protein n=1 Tax=Methylorubrum extorquens TaxID=408 RepID=UPI001EE50FEE|nr:hypothetical protein [Methylorubrum extorquens]MCG5249501.1 hypothetical protein [Methylorubrum extorquens]
MSEHRVGYGLTRLDHLAGVGRLGFGIDGSGLAGFTDMFALMQLAALTMAGARRNEMVARPRRLLELATLGGPGHLASTPRSGPWRRGGKPTCRSSDSTASTSRVSMAATRSRCWSTQAAPRTSPSSWLAHAW